MQNGAKDSTDTGLLAFAIEPNVGDRDFFVRKGIDGRCASTPESEPGLGAGCSVAGCTTFPRCPAARSTKAPGVEMTGSGYQPLRRVRRSRWCAAT